MDKLYRPQEGGFLPTLIVFLFAIFVLYGSFLTVRELALKRTVNQAQNNILLMQEQEKALQGETLQAVVKSKQWKTRIEAERMPWATVLQELSRVTPVGIFFSSYAAGEDGTLQIAGVADTPSSVSALMQALYKSTFFKDEFVPSVTVGTGASGQSITNFSLNLKFVNPAQQ